MDKRRRKAFKIFLLTRKGRIFRKKTVKRLINSNGETITDQKLILNKIREIYQDLFQSKDYNLIESDLNNLVSNKKVTTLTQNESLELEGTLTIEELYISLKAMKNGKCPGIDGFPVEFFKVFWKKLKFFILKALNYAYDTGEMPLSLRQCLITCLPKGNKPRHYLRNWRPISLLSVVHKIGSSAIANRIKKHLDKIISKCQTGFLSDRYIGDSTCLIYDIMQQTEAENIPGLLTLVDFWFHGGFYIWSWSF